MPASGKLKLSTIVNPGVEITSQYLSTWVSFIPVFIKGLNETFGPIAKQSLKAEPFLITKSSPGVGTVAKGKTYISTSFFGLWTTAKAW